MNGFEFRKAQLQDPKLANIPVVVCSSLRDPTILAKQISATAHLDKLFDPAKLLALVETHCRRGSATGSQPSGAAS